MIANCARPWVSFAPSSIVGNVAKSTRLNSMISCIDSTRTLSREIWKRYASTHLKPAVASAVAAGVLRKEELPTELVQHIAGLIEFYEHDLSAS